MVIRYCSGCCMWVVLCFKGIVWTRKTMGFEPMTFRTLGGCSTNWSWATRTLKGSWVQTPMGTRIFFRVFFMRVSAISLKHKMVISINPTSEYHFSRALLINKGKYHPYSLFSIHAGHWRVSPCLFELIQMKINYFWNWYPLVRFILKQLLLSVSVPSKKISTSAH